jgi:hypothetical protein
MSSINTPVRRPKARNTTPSSQAFDEKPPGRIPSVRKLEHSGGQSYSSFSRAHDMQGSGTTPRSLKSDSQFLYSGVPLTPPSQSHFVRQGDNSPRIHSDYPTRQHYPEFISLFETAALQLIWALAGLRDAFRWDRVVSLLVT